jgi:DNA-binding beta-propeller fold protein YncE
LAAEKRPPTLELLGKVLLPGVHGRIDHLAADVYQGRLFVAAFGDGSVQVLDIRHNSILDSLSGLAEPHSVVYIKPSNRILVVSAGDGLDNFAIALDEAHRRVFVACRRPPLLLALDMDSGLVLAGLPASGGADDLFYDPIHARLYVMSGEGGESPHTRKKPPIAMSKPVTIATVAGARTGSFVPEWNRLSLAVREFGRHPAEIRIYQPR